MKGTERRRRFGGESATDGRRLTSHWLSLRLPQTQCDGCQLQRRALCARGTTPFVCIQATSIWPVFISSHRCLQCRLPQAAALVQARAPARMLPLRWTVSPPPLVGIENRAIAHPCTVTKAVSPYLTFRFPVAPRDGGPDYVGKGRLEGKVCVVTGGGGAIGGTVCEVFAKEGGTVYFCDRGPDPGTARCKAIVDAGGRSSFEVVDVCDTPALKEWIDGVGEKEGRIDVLIPNAAVSCVYVVEVCCVWWRRDDPLLQAFVFGHIEEVDDDAWDKVLKTNVVGYANCAKFALPWMRKTGAGGSIVNMASVSSHIAQPAFVPCAYQRVDACVHSHIHTYIHTHTYTRIHARTRTYTRTRRAHGSLVVAISHTHPPLPPFQTTRQRAPSCS